VKKAPGIDWKGMIVENGSYKLVALFVTLILWVTILGRRDIELSKELAIEYLIPKGMSIAPGPGHSEVDRNVVVKVSGPNAQLKNFREQPPTVAIDLTKSEAGPIQAVITPRSIDVPRGVKVLTVGPSVVSVTLVPAADHNSDSMKEEK
jgi:hypothetical protein